MQLGVQSIAIGNGSWRKYYGMVEAKYLSWKQKLWAVVNTGTGGTIIGM